MHDYPAPLTDQPLVLASASATRAGLLQHAGIAIEARPSGIDEAAVIEAVTGQQGSLSPEDIAAILARAKAQDVEASHAGRLVLGADQTLELDGQLFSKPDSLETARRNLLALRGRTHALHASAALVYEGEMIWQHTETAWLTMRDFTPQFLGRYMASAGEHVMESVGSYQVESVGVQLFEKFEGSWFAILGLPLMPLLEVLRQRRALPA